MTLLNAIEELRAAAQFLFAMPKVAMTRLMLLGLMKMLKVGDDVLKLLRLLQAMCENWRGWLVEEGGN